MSQGPLIDPEHERLAAWLLLAWLAMGLVGIVTVIGGASAAVILTIRWAFDV